MKKLALGLLVLLPFLVLLYGTLRFAIDMPYMDEWDLVPLLQKSYAGTLTVRDLFLQHNESRPFFPRLIMIPLAHLTAWNINYEMGVVILLALGMFLIVADQSIRTSRACGHRSNRWLLPIQSALIFSILQYECWTFGFTLTGYLSVFFTLAGLAVLARPPFAWPRFGLAVLAGGIAMFSYANGILFWVAGLVALITIAREERRRLWLPGLLWILSGGGLTLAYFYTYQVPSRHPSLAGALHAPIGIVDFLTTFLGGAVANISDVTVSLRLGMVMLLAFLICGLAGFWWSGRTFKALGFWLASGTYVLLSGLTLALGRSAWGVETALSSRYTILSSLFWIAALMLITVFIQHILLTWKQGLKYIAARLLAISAGLCLVASSVLFIFSSLQAWQLWNRQYYFQMIRANELLTSQLDPVMIAEIYPNLDKLRPRLEFLTRQRLSMFRDYKPLSAYAMAPAQSNNEIRVCNDGDPADAGLASNQAFAAGSWLLNGKFPAPLNGHLADAILLVDSNQAILARGPAIVPAIDSAKPDSGWALDLKASKLPIGTSRIQVYALYAAANQVACIGAIELEVKPMSALREYIKTFVAVSTNAGFTDEFVVDHELIRGRGWAQCPDSKPAWSADELVLITDQATNLLTYTRIGAKRPDVAAACNNPKLLHSGWHVAFSTNQLILNPSVLRAYLVLQEEQKAVRLANEFTINLP